MLSSRIQLISLMPISREMAMLFTASGQHVSLKSAPYFQRRWHFNRDEHYKISLRQL